MNCNQANLIFLVSTLISNHSVLTGGIVDPKKIVKYCSGCSESDITDILDCFVSNGLLFKTDTYHCVNDHFFTPTKEEIDTGYECYKCFEQGESEEVSYIDAPHIKEHYLYSTYRVDTKINKDIWTANAYAIGGDIENSVRILLKVLKEEEGETLDKKVAIEKIRGWISLGNASTSLAEKIVEYVNVVF